MWRVGELALLQAWVCVPPYAAFKCANSVSAEFHFFLCDGEKIRNIALVSVSV